MAYRTSLSYLFILLILSSKASAHLHRFQSWFPRYSTGLNYVVQHNCSAQYQAYLNDNITSTEFDPFFAIWGPYNPADALIQCIMSVIPESIKANMGSAQVLLGLMPTILASIGPSVQETAMLLVVGKRPLLALCLTLGSPAIYIERSFDYREGFKTLKASKDLVTPSNPLRHGGIIITLFLYMIALTAIANITLLSYEIVMKSSSVITPNAPFLPALWSFIAIVIHLSGALALHTRVNVSRIDSDTGALLNQSSFKWLKMQFGPRNHERIRVTPRRISLGYQLINWFATILTACHIVYGTLLFSNILFVSTRDSVGIILRYIASVIFCRMIVLYELSMIRDLVRLEPEPSSTMEAEDMETKSG